MAMVRRIVVFPVLGRRWAFTAVLPTGCDGKSLPAGSLRNLLDTLRSTPQNSDRVELLTQYFSDKMYEKFTAWEATPEGSFRNRLHSIGQRMLSRLGPTETFLKAIPKDAGLVEIVYPYDSINSRLVRRRVRHLAISGEVVHRRYMYGSIALLPFAVVLGVLPLPNVVLAWNLFRAYSHWRALQGSRRLNFLVTESSSASDDAITGKQGEQSNTFKSDLSPDHKTQRNETTHWVLLPSKKLDTLIKLSNVPRDAITDGTVAEICKEYPLDPLEIMKWRDQKLAIKSFR
ncbi:hypothetical protein MPTK1_2g05920 [Marchantia polymorpha subsp. ruderalis]|uniref:Uncharacterized protein n=1 Tax=Marchantia polymorpha TaxID=3197 RepID=A0A2R6XDK0_MARPO|nr:hypothetical protein MARPO_0021s0048 [Marchantia polymorpha]PTQ44178.1 hypothetical protein MARPO_0021s0048 [Marchantia polymorpha]BBN01249.1 hypothetical protein Mp_2g05920 [Marchantia polymorpha subsp. ruderalis]BBN01250.1 hypothetical protein Mp_2g05920 [Marchantia polymorpha subsp. ruderalis]|eukprot:PTQ44175.1 hypothetical protein MARPO_0021s0048 [Marchantia polymorpha]